MNIQDLVNHYVELSATTDDHRRHDLVGQLFADSAVHYAAPPANVSFTGIEAIEANIAQENRRTWEPASSSAKATSSRTTMPFSCSGRS